MGVRLGVCTRVGVCVGVCTRVWVCASVCAHVCGCVRLCAHAWVGVSVCVHTCVGVCVQLFVTLWTVAHKAPLSMRLSRQEYQSGLPCPPPGDLPTPGIEPRSPALQVDSLLSEPPGMPKNTGVGSLSRLQGIFQTQEMNQSLLDCRRIFYQLSYLGSPQNIASVLQFSR